jgi:hypothetical protein
MQPIVSLLSLLCCNDVLRYFLHRIVTNSPYHRNQARPEVSYSNKGKFVLFVQRPERWEKMTVGADLISKVCSL